MKPKYWNKGKAFLSKKDRVLKRIMDTFPNEHLFLNIGQIIIKKASSRRVEQIQIYIKSD